MLLDLLGQMDGFIHYPAAVCPSGGGPELSMMGSLSSSTSTPSKLRSSIFQNSILLLKFVVDVQSSQLGSMTAVAACVGAAPAAAWWSLLKTFDGSGHGVSTQKFEGWLKKSITSISGILHREAFATNLCPILHSPWPKMMTPASLFFL